MEQNLPVLAKKFWKLMRVVLSMIRKGILKKKLLLDISMMIKRGKIAGKGLQNLMFHHHNHPAEFAINHRPGEYEFSCSNSPSTHNHPFSLFSFHKKHHSSTQHAQDDHEIMVLNAAVLKAMKMIQSETASPVLPGFGVVRQLRVTDSPFPLRCADDQDSHVDEAAEQFISRFYNDLRLENGN
ncbi:hypothetical protein R6Q59_028766 [Mikania micrantha]|uniref:Avr9/Cf-9 rapidly elicited protein 146 n=1 Tax=Mikania micrantha TaxID=192012 RepID=A0A5N6LXN3_9ASTR|nr:hypothetical protein E3N88_39598 [Mikania micrantha]